MRGIKQRTASDFAPKNALDAFEDARPHTPREPSMEERLRGAQPIGGKASKED